MVRDRGGGRTELDFGDGHGFLCGWCYWVNNILYYPNLLMSTAVVGTYAFWRGGTAKVIGGAGAFVALGGLIYFRGRRR